MSPKEEYISFCTANWVPLFSRPSWWDLVLDDWQVERFENNKGEVAYLPHTSYKKLGFSFSRNPFLTPYSGLVYKQKCDTAAKLDFINQANSFLEKFSISSYNCHFHFHEKVNTASQGTTHILDLSAPYDDIKKGYSTNIKRQLKKAMKTLHVFEESKLQNFYGCYLDSMQRNKVQEIVPKEIMNKVFAHTEEDMSSQIFSAQPAKEPGDVHASIWMISDEKYAYYLLGGSKQTSLGSGAMAALINQCIITAQINERQYFDFEGSENPGVAAFFAKFGAQKIQYPILTSKTNPKLNALLKLKGLLKK